MLEDWSPEQISGYAPLVVVFNQSRRIYQFAMEDKEQGGQLYMLIGLKNYEITYL
ncbi:hypothetical protein [Legionella drozanskii]|uniref:hypothetical protein n=1 Tax=Legionella drozanskii TaxID=96228 RepID=UPI0012EE1E2F|nr:hypothetical protein [Legionella drozanskii]